MYERPYKSTKIHAQGTTHHTHPHIVHLSTPSLGMTYFAKSLAFAFGNSCPRRQTFTPPPDEAIEAFSPSDSPSHALNLSEHFGVSNASLMRPIDTALSLSLKEVPYLLNSLLTQEKPLVHYPDQKASLTQAPPPLFRRRPRAPRRLICLPCCS